MTQGEVARPAGDDRGGARVTRCTRDCSGGAVGVDMAARLERWRRMEAEAKRVWLLKNARWTLHLAVALSDAGGPP